MAAQNAPNKPALIDEFGLANVQWGQTKEMRASREIVDFHNGIWASAMSGVSGTAMFWWWDRLDPRGHYVQYRPLSRFLSGIPWTALHLKKMTASVSGAPVRAVGLQAEDRAYFWLFDPQASWKSVVIDKVKPQTRTGVEVEITGLVPGTYRVEWWDTQAGEIVQQVDSQLQRSALRLAVPPWNSDIAAKVIRFEEVDQ